MRRANMNTTSLKLGDVHVMLADGRAHIRSTLKTALAHAGLDHVDHTGTLDALAGSMDEVLGPDILICDMGLKEGAACDLVQSIRQTDIGKNPFLCILGVTWNPTEVAVVKMINAGVDLLVAAPMSPKQVLDRVEAMVYSRLPFVVTSSYIGPDRRKDHGREQTVPLIDVPNTLRAKALGTWNATQMLREIEQATNELKARKFECQAGGIAEIATRIYEEATGASGTSIARSTIDRLHALVRELDRRANDRSFYHIAELCEACVGVINKMMANPDAATDRDLLVVQHLALAIRKAMRPDGHAMAIAQDIAKTVNTAR